MKDWASKVEAKYHHHHHPPPKARSGRLGFGVSSCLASAMVLVGLSLVSCFLGLTCMEVRLRVDMNPQEG